MGLTDAWPGRLLLRGGTCGLVALVAAGVAPEPAFARSPVLQTTAAQRVGLKILVIEGEDAVNVIQQRTAAAPVVEVRDRNDQPVAGAVVTFAIRGGRATFNGARTLSLTTNAAGRAAASGLTPTGSGAFQISATAAFQGQTAVATIIQTNVLTAVQAAQVATVASTGGAGGGAATGGATAGGAVGGGAATAGAVATTAAAAAGGGISATTIGIVGAAVGGTLVTAKAVSSHASDSTSATTTYTGTFSGPFTWSFPGACTRTEQHSGPVEINLDPVVGGAVNGTGGVTGTSLVTAINNCGPTPSGPQVGSSSPLGVSPVPVTGTASGLAFRAQESNTIPASPPVPAELRTTSFTFSGSLVGGVITGTLSETDTTSNVNGTGSGSATFAVTLR